ncbi:YhcB family protein [Testudinibacter sp. P80/BLE/0925]|uniref:YhcB family protein n=1 Tax=Testudinibacter sp. TW-1 TaxID=3417757 RepID=UPI003D35A628
METAANSAITGNPWLIGFIGVVIGFVLAYFLIRATSGNVRKQVQTESELKQVKTEVEQQKAKIEEHFAESADLLKSMAQDYQRLYKHLAKSSVALLPETTAKAIFEENPLLESGGKEAEAADTAAGDKVAAEATAVEDVAGKDQPKDYSKGSSGLLKSKEA